MSSRAMGKRKVVLGAAAVALLVGLITVPSFAAAQKTVTLNVSPGSAAANTAAPGVEFSLKVTNTTPGSSNPSSIRVIVPSTPSGFQITAASIDQANSSNGSNSSALPPVINSAKTSVDFNNISPVQTGQWITLKVSATTPSICPSTSVTSSDWQVKPYTGSTVGQAQLFTTTNSGTSATRTTLTASACPAAPGPIVIDTQDPVRATPATSLNFIDGKTNVTLYSSTVTGTPAPTITWQYSSTSSFPASPTVAGTGSTLSLTPATATAEGYYRAVASNSSGSSTSNVIQLVKSTLTLEFTSSPTDAFKGATIAGTSGDVAVAFKADGTVSSAFDGATVTISNSGSGTGNLTGNTDTLSGGTASFPSLSIDDAGSYTLTATVDGGPSTDPVDITISDGNINCGQTVTTNNDGDVTQTVDATQLNKPGCSLKPYTLTHNGSSVEFLYPTGQTASAFTIDVHAFAPEAVPSGPVPMTTVNVKFDSSGNLITSEHPIQWCLTDADGNTVLPGHEATCLLSQSTVTLPTDQIQVSETYYLLGDILYKR